MAFGEARTLKPSQRSCQKSPVVSRWKTGDLSEGGRFSNVCFEDDGESVGWEFDMTVEVQVLHASSPHVQAPSDFARDSEQNTRRLKRTFIQ